MGMFDSFYFAKGVLPDNKVPEDHEFQSKCAECSLDKYYVDNFANVVRYEINSSEGYQLNLTPINIAAEVYSHEFLYENSTDILNRKYIGCKYQKYGIIIVNSKLIRAEKLKEEGYEDEIL